MKAPNKVITFATVAGLSIFSFSPAALADELPQGETDIEDQEQVTEDEQAKSDEPLQLTLDDVRSMMKDKRYFDPRHRDDSFVKKVDEAFQRLYRG